MSGLLPVAKEKKFMEKHNDFKGSTLSKQKKSQIALGFFFALNYNFKRFLN